MSNKIVSLSTFKHQLHLTFVAKCKYLMWLVISNIIFLTNIPYPNFIKVYLLRIMGAKIGHSCIIKPWVKIKLPWKLTLGDNVWLGESAWIDNISNVVIGSNVCISQNALLLTGNHDYTSSSFDLNSKPIVIEDGAWVCANVTITGGVTIKSHSVVGVGLIISKDTNPYEVYSVNASSSIKKRVIR